MSGCCFNRAGRSARRGTQKGYVLIFGALTLFFVLVPASGLAIDVGMMYVVKSLLSAASDGAALAGARAFSRGSDDASQRANAESTANSYLNANFPSGYMWSTNLQVNSVAGTDSQYVRSLTTTASVQLPLVFLRFFRTESTTVSASSKATRRDANVMFVMDRSTSLQQSGSCTPLKNAAENFIDKFAEGRDNVGLITFGTNSRVDNPLSTTFKTAITATLTNLSCNGYTNTAQGLWQAYDALVNLNQTGALNVLLLFTDGLPTAVTEDFPVKASPDQCTPKNPPILGVAIDNATGLYAKDYPPDQQTVSGTSNCNFPSSLSHLQYAPSVDHWGNMLDTSGSYTRYKTVTYSGGHITLSSTNIQNGATNAADSAAWRIRSGSLDNGKSLPNVFIYAIGYGSGADNTLLKRISNDPSLSPNPVAAGAQGRYEYAGDATQLNDAFTRVASQVLRLAQ